MVWLLAVGTKPPQWLDLPGEQPFFWIPENPVTQETFIDLGHVIYQYKSWIF